MASAGTAPPVKLFVVTLHNDPEILQKAIGDLKDAWGEVDWISDDYEFDVTDYYSAEMGTKLLRRFYSFANLIQPDQITDIKLFSNSIEEQYRSNSSRRINLDPGYLDTYKVVLASAKFGGQKIYLERGIYADMTLVRYKGKWESFAWGFPDFKSRRYDAVLSTIREIYKKQA